MVDDPAFLNRQPCSELVHLAVETVELRAHVGTVVK
jgi:hypothetical protein